MLITSSPIILPFANLAYPIAAAMDIAITNATITPNSGTTNAAIMFKDCVFPGTEKLMVVEGDSSIGSFQNSGSSEALVDSMIGVLKKNVRENPDFSALLFEMWVSGRRSAKIKKVFDDGLNESIDRLKTLLEFAARMGIIKIDPAESEGIVRTLLAMYHGLAMQLLSNPKKAEDEKIWAPIRRTLLLMMMKKSP